MKSSEKQLNTLRKLVRYNPLSFAQTCLDHLLKYEVPKFHFEIYRLLGCKRLAIAAPRSFAKSTIVSLIYPLWLVLTQERRDILIVSATYSLSEDWLRKIKYELENNKAIWALFGNQVGDTKWTEGHIVLKNGNIIRAQGRGCQIRGFRPTNVVIDDIEDDEEVRSKDQREKLEEWFWKALLNTLEKECQIIVIGTLLSPLALLVQLLRKKNWTTKIYKALQKDGTSLWPEKWSAEALRVRKQEIGSIAFESEFQNNPLASEFTVFRVDWIKTYRTVKKFKRENMYVITTIDPSVSEKETADFTAINTMGYIVKGRGRGKIFNLESKAGRWSLVRVADEFFQTYETHHSDLMWIEEFGYQHALKQYFDEEMIRRKIDLPIRQIKLGRSVRSGSREKAKDKVTRAKRISYLMEQGKVFIRSDHKGLYDQLVVFPFGDYDDLVDAFVYGLLLIQELQVAGAVLLEDNQEGLGGAFPSFEIREDGTVPVRELLFEREKLDWRYF